MKNLLWKIPAVVRLKPDVIQASDVREISWSLLLGILTKASMVYDSHEDYFNQLYEFRGKSFRSLVTAIYYSAMEVLFLRFFKAIYCTDDYLLEKYSKPLYSAKQVKLLRSFPLLANLHGKRNFEEKNILKLVYIGTVNEYRGLYQCADYLTSFNRRYSPQKTLTLSIYANNHPVIAEILKLDPMISHYQRVAYLKLLEILRSYDAGICLWLRIKKFERNLPLKNFDYMSAGLPIITSNFGNLDKYAKTSGAAICIDPLSYDQFEEAILKMFDPAFRGKLSRTGIHYIREHASFEVESSNYVKTLINLANGIAS